MKNPEQEIENALRQAPQPPPPAALKQRLLSQIQLPSEPAVSLLDSRPGWFRRWWPALAPAAISIACAFTFTAQQSEIRDLKQNLAVLTQASGPSKPQTDAQPDAAAAIDPAQKEAEEIARLKQLVTRLTGEIAELEQVRAENEQLRAQLAMPAPGALSNAEADALALAQEREMRIVCVNNLKQLGLSVKVWALDNGDMTPPNVLCMTNEMSTPKILVCPADKGRQAAASWAAWTAGNCSYEYLAASTAETEDPYRVLFRCPVHGNIGLLDGSVQSEVAKTHPEWLVQRDGKLYFENSRTVAQPPQQ